MFNFQRIFFLALKWYKWSKSLLFRFLSLDKKIPKSRVSHSFFHWRNSTHSFKVSSVSLSIRLSSSKITLSFYIYMSSTYTSFKSKIHVRQVFRTWDLNQQEFVQRNCEWILMLLVESLALNKCLLGEMNMYIYIFFLFSILYLTSIYNIYNIRNLAIVI